MPLFLGLDGGGTGCRAAVADETGRILGSATGGPSNIASDPEGARANIIDVATEALAGQGSLFDLHAVLGVAGANVAACATRMIAELPFASTRIVSDAVIAVKGALQAGDGVVAAIGTGSVFAVQRSGEIRQIGGSGLILGDEASGAWLGRALLARVLRARDGFLPLTPLLAEVLAEFGGADGVIRFSLAARPTDFATLAPRLVRSTDPAAQALLKEGACEVEAHVALLQAGGSLPLTFLGGLGATYEKLLEGRWPIRPALGSGLDGALWMARQGVAA